MDAAAPKTIIIILNDPLTLKCLNIEMSIRRIESECLPAAENNCIQKDLQTVIKSYLLK